MIYRKPLEFRPGASAADVTQLCWNVLEPSIHEQPECWLWAYKHWRFRPGDDQTAAIRFMPMSPSALTRCWRGRERLRLDSFKIGKLAVLDPDDDRGFPGIASLIEADVAGDPGKVPGSRKGVAKGRVLRATRSLQRVGDQPDGVVGQRRAELAARTETLRDKRR